MAADLELQLISKEKVIHSSSNHENYHPNMIPKLHVSAILQYTIFIFPTCEEKSIKYKTRATQVLLLKSQR